MQLHLDIRVEATCLSFFGILQQSKVSGVHHTPQFQGILVGLLTPHWRNCHNACAVMLRACARGTPPASRDIHAIRVCARRVLGAPLLASWLNISC